jgi:proteasome alpha subunit
VYDRIAFAGAGRYSEFENLRKAGIRHADMKGFLYSRDDVNAKSLVNAYSQALGTVFGQEIKPLEVEILVVAVGMGDEPNEIYRVSFDGSIFDEKGFTVIGGKSESVLSKLKSRCATSPSSSSLREVVVSSVTVMGEVNGQKLSHEGLEVAILSRSCDGRVFRRLPQTELSQYLNGANPINPA